MKEFVFHVDKECKDLDFVCDLLALVESGSIAAPAPIEQRWSAASRSHLSPAYSEDRRDVFSWTNIIMYRIGDKQVPESFLTVTANHLHTVISALGGRGDSKSHEEVLPHGHRVSGFQISPRRTPGQGGDGVGGLGRDGIASLSLRPAQGGVPCGSAQVRSQGDLPLSTC